MNLSNSSTTSFSPLPQLTILGRSRAGDETCWAIPELKVWCDAGARVVPWTPRHILLTHTHADHVQSLTTIINTQQPHTTIQLHVPHNQATNVQEYLRAFETLIRDVTTTTTTNDPSHTTNHTTANYTIQPRTVGDTFPLGQGYWAQTVQCHHRTTCLGYSITQTKQSLLPEYTTLSGTQLRQLRQQGVEITRTVSVPLLCVLGDTTEQVFVQHPEILQQHKVVLVECTFLRDEDLERAEETQHMHWQRLQPWVQDHPRVLFLLTHFSLKYRSSWIRSFFAHYRNVHPMLPVEHETTERCACWVCRPTAA